jgi:hypothetical protein
MQQPPPPPLAALAPARTPEVVQEPTPAPDRAPEPDLAATTVPAPTPARAFAKPRGDALGDERSLVEQARSALARQDFKSALTALEDHEKRFPRGQLTEERSALKVVALSGAGRHEDAQAEAARFRAKYPDSLLMPLVDSAR